MMYTTIQTYYLKPGSCSELKQRIQTLVEPRISIFDSKGHADIASGPSGYWIRDALSDFVLGLPEIIAGHTDVYNGRACSSQRDRQQVGMDPLMGVF